MKKIALAILATFVTVSVVFVVAYKDQFNALWISLQPTKNLPTEQQVNTNLTEEKEPDVTPIPVNETPKNFTLSEGFSMSILVGDVQNPRTLMIGPNGNVWATLTSAGKIVEVIDVNGDGKAEEVRTLTSGLRKPHGLEKKCKGKICDIFIAETERLSSYTFDAGTGKLVFKEKLTDLPAGGRHFTRSLVFFDNRLLISIGSSCDVCHEKDERHGSVQIFDLTSKKLAPYARGLRNAVFMTQHPETKKVWVTEMGRDFLGDNLPPDELNILQENGNFGWPICYGQNIHDDSFDKNTYIRNPCMAPYEISSEIDIPAHSAPLGLSFIPKEGWPEEYQGDLLVAYHGSWNRTQPTGYKIVRYNFDANGKLQGIEDFLAGFLVGKTLYGRPAGILALPNGKIFISDDKAGRIYQINYQK